MSSSSATRVANLAIKWRCANGVARGRDRGGAGRPAARLSSGRTAGVQAGGDRDPAGSGIRGAGDRPDRAGSPAAEQLPVRRRVSGAVRPARAEAGFDLAASLVLLALTWPMLLLAALAIGLESGFREPILYRQIRVGQHDRPFDDPQVPHHAGRCDAGGEGSLSPTIPASRGLAGSCGKPASTNCPSGSTCCAAR